MIGRHRILIQNKSIQYDFEIVRNITVIRGNSGSGKTALINMISQYERDGESSGINLSCDKPCTVLTGLRWQENLAGIHDSIVFIDEDDRFIISNDFAVAVRESDNYYVLVTRDNLSNLPYSVDEIYGIHTSGKYSDLKKTYNEFYRIYSREDVYANRIPEKLVVEDSKAGYQFFLRYAEEKGIECVSADSKSGIYALLIAEKEKAVLAIADGAAFGSEMNRINELIDLGYPIILYLPESFEWLILKSGLVDGKRVQEILDAPEKYIESKDYFSWERYFTRLLTDETNGTFLHYSKDKLNEVYLHEKERNMILDAMGEVLSDAN